MWSKICIHFYLMQKRNLICFCFKPFSLSLFISVLYWRHTNNIMQLKGTGVSFNISWIFLLSCTQMTKCCLYGRTNIHIVMLVYLCRMERCVWKNICQYGRGFAFSLPPLQEFRGWASKCYPVKHVLSSHWLSYKEREKTKVNYPELL